MVAQFYLLPSWFFGFDIFLEILFGIITAFVALFSMKVYRLCEHRDCKLLGYAFVSISISYFLLAILNLLAASSQIGGEIITISLNNITVPSSIWIYAYIFFFLFGLSILAYLTFGKSDQRLLALITSLSLIIIVFSPQAGIAFNFVAAVLLFYVVLYYYDRVKVSGGGGTVFVFIAFLLLLFARLSFAFSYLNPLPYVANHVLELIAYCFILVGLIKIIKK